MKAVILAGGLGTRLSEETDIRPKPMVEIGGKPMLWHIMNWYSKFGITEFIICGGYKVEVIKNYLKNYAENNRDICYNLCNGMQITKRQNGENWYVTCVDTGLNTMTGGRLLKVREFLSHEVYSEIVKYKEAPDEDFFLTYGDGVGNIDILDVLTIHNVNLNIVTTTAYKSLARFGVLDIQDGKVLSFKEKPGDQQPWINAGFMVCNKAIFDYIDGDSTVLEHEPLQRLAAEGKMGAYKHTGFWKAMDTLRDKIELEELWRKNGNIYGE